MDAYHTMKTYLYSASFVAALALAASSAPFALAHAQIESEGSAEASATTSVQARLLGEDVHEDSGVHVRLREEASTTGVSASTTAHTRAARALLVREAHRASSTEAEHGNATSTMMRERALANFVERIQLKLEATTTPARSLLQLQQMMQERAAALSQEVASSTPSDRAIIKNANRVRLAVHALLASKDLLGGIGPQVSAVAQQINESVATTTNAEAEIQSRGFFSKLLWGGDKHASAALDQVTQLNQNRIQELTELLSQASSTPEVQASLEAQVQAIQQEQVRLRSVAEGQAKLWGLLSWRL